MKGSAKQLAWASEIQEKMVGIIAEAIAACEASNVDTNKKANFISQMNILKYNVQNVGYAGELISVFGQVEHTGDYKKDIAAVRSAIKVNDVNSTFSKAIPSK